MEKDIVAYKEQGMVIVIGDFNSRIGKLKSITADDKTYNRENVDEKENQNGRELIKLMNGLGMIILSGIRSQSKFTCVKVMKNKMRKSVVDHICIQEGMMESIVDEETREDIMELIKTDHAMVAMTLKIRILKMEEEKKKQPHRTKKNNNPKPLHKITNREVWEQYKEDCKGNIRLKQLAEKLKKLDENKKNARIVEEKWEEFKSIIISLEDWIRNIDKNLGEKQFTYLNQMIKNNDEIIVALQTKKKAWKNYESSKGTDSEQRKWKHFKWTRNRAKKLLKRKLENHKKAAIKEIEELRVDNSRLYWKKLKEINGKSKKKIVWDTALNEEGEEVTG